jgi:hypothetical protein
VSGTRLAALFFAMRNAARLALVCFALVTTTGCSREVLPIAVFAAAATVQTVQAVDAYCSRDDVHCTKGQGAPVEHYEVHEDPYSAAVDW